MSNSFEWPPWVLRAVSLVPGRGSGLDGHGVHGGASGSGGGRPGDARRGLAGDWCCHRADSSAFQDIAESLCGEMIEQGAAGDEAEQRMILAFVYADLPEELRPFFDEPSDFLGFAGVMVGSECPEILE